MPVGPDNCRDFVSYCLSYGEEHDASFVSVEDLDSFSIDKGEEVAYLLQENDTVIGAVSLMIAPYRPKQTARFRILHCKDVDYVGYERLWQAVIPHLPNVNSVYLFIPESNSQVGAILSKLGFSVERYSWGMVRSSRGCPQPVFPTGFVLRPIEDRESDIAAWVEVINSAVFHLAGHVPATNSRVKKLLASNQLLPKGAQTLWQQSQLVGLFCCGKEGEEGAAEIGPLAVVPRFQGKGIGTNLLRAALQLAAGAGYDRCWLSVNAENKQAASLYLKEGFHKRHAMVCYRRTVYPRP